MAGHGKRQVSFQTKKTKGDYQGGNDGSKNEKNSKNSGNTKDNQSYFSSGGIQPLISRERSFVRTRSNAAKEQAAGSYHESGVDVQRPRSFVHPMQMQHQVREAHPHRRRGSQMMAASTRGKPAMEIYRPPTLRGPCFFEPNGELFYNGGKLQADNHAMHQYNHAQQQAYNASQKHLHLNIHAKEFISGKNNQNSHLQHSKSTTGVSQNHGHPLSQSKSGHNLRNSFAGQDSNCGPSPAVRGVHFSDDKENHGKNSRQASLSIGGAPMVGVKRSKSLGCGDFKEFFKGSSPSSTTTTTSEGISPLADIGPFSHEITSLITNAYNDPSALTARHLMDIVRHLMTRVTEASRYAEPTARLCIAIIQSEKEETFLESLLNSCQEYFQERDRLLRSSTSSSSQSNLSSTHPNYVTAYPKWIAYMSFLNEMYTQLKRRHVQLMKRRMRNSETAPGLLLLTLLAQCCSICLKEPSVNSLQEMECLFFVLTAIGKDIELELPNQMARVMAAARDAFINSVKVSAVQKTLLQLIEMHAAGWNMPGPAVMYYYPGSGAK